MRVTEYQMMIPYNIQYLFHFAATITYISQSKNVETKTCILIVNKSAMKLKMSVIQKKLYSFHTYKLQQMLI